VSVRRGEMTSVAASATLRCGHVFARRRRASSVRHSGCPVPPRPWRVLPCAACSRSPCP
jgi:hypothetical protein